MNFKNPIIILICLIINGCNSDSHHQEVEKLNFEKTHLPSDKELMELIMAEIEEKGNESVERIIADSNSSNQKIKILSSKKFTNGSLTIFNNKNSSKRFLKKYTIDKTNYTEDYILLNWPVFIKITKGNKSEKFYFDKTNLLLWITVDGEYKNPTSEIFFDKQQELFEKLKIMNITTNMYSDEINEDEITALQE